MLLKNLCYHYTTNSTKILQDHGIAADDYESRNVLLKHSAVLWHHLTELSRISGSYSTAFSSLLQAKTNQPKLFQLHPELYHERAHVLWESNHKFEAIKELQRTVNGMYCAIDADVKGTSSNKSTTPSNAEFYLSSKRSGSRSVLGLAYTNVCIIHIYMRY